MNTPFLIVAGRLMLLSSAAQYVAPQAEPQEAVPHHFEVASIKPSKPGAVVQDARIDFPGGRFEAWNITVKDLLFALSFFRGRVEGGPKWTETDRYDIIAKVEGDVAPQREEYVRALLADRFKLVVHHEARVESGLALSTSKAQPALSPAKEGEPAVVGKRDHDRVIFQAVTMPTLANYLHQILRSTVTDKTGLNGKFDFTLDLVSPDAASPAIAGQDTFSDRVRDAIEQVGFRLETQKVAVDVTVIDRVERPSEN